MSAKALLETNDMMRNATIASGVIGYNLNVANILAAVFIATGQDVACVVESASCQFFIAPAKKDEIISQGINYYHFWRWLQAVTMYFLIV